MVLNIKKQYDSISESYSKLRPMLDEQGDKDFYAQFYKIVVRKGKLLDVGCGNGDDLKNLQGEGFDVFGIDPSKEFIDMARRRNKLKNVSVASGEELPFKNNSFDVVVSKYALQTSEDPHVILKEVSRVLRPGGKFIFLIKHPMRQFLEKKSSADSEVSYFEKEVVTSSIFGGEIILNEPSHTLQDYLNTDFLKHFDLINFFEGFDFPASEQIDGDTYPTYFIISAERKEVSHNISDTLSVLRFNFKVVSGVTLFWFCLTGFTINVHFIWLTILSCLLWSALAILSLNSNLFRISKT